MKYKIFIILFSFIFIPVLKADTYYDYEIIEVNDLPLASNSTMNKVYFKDNKYYVTQEINSGYTPLPLNEDLIGKTIYYKDFTDVFNSNFVKNHKLYDFYALTVPSGSYIYSNNVIYNLCSFNDTTSIYGVKYYLSFKDKGQRQSSTYTTSCIINSWATFEEFDISQYFSLTPFEIIYDWKEVPKENVIEIIVPKEDFYLFFTFEDISSFNILSKYDLFSFNDFQKIVVVLGFNSFFLGFIGFCIYIIIKLINKGISLLFK